MSGGNNIFLISECVETQDFLYLLFDYNQLIHADYVIKIPSLREWKYKHSKKRYNVNFKMSQVMFDRIYDFDDSHYISTNAGNFYCNANHRSFGIITSGFYINLPPESTEPNGVTYNNIELSENHLEYLEKVFKYVKERKGSPDNYDTLTVTISDHLTYLIINDSIEISITKNILTIILYTTRNNITKEFPIDDRIKSQLSKIISYAYKSNIKDDFVRSQLDTYLSQVEYTPYPNNPKIDSIKKSYQEALLAREPSSSTN